MMAVAFYGLLSAIWQWLAQGCHYQNTNSNQPAVNVADVDSEFVTDVVQPKKIVVV